MIKAFSQHGTRYSQVCFPLFLSIYFNALLQAYLESRYSVL